MTQKWAIINDDGSFTICDYQPSDSDLNVAELQTTPEPDKRYYAGSGKTYRVDGDVVIEESQATQKPLARLKEDAITRIKKIASDKLSKTDWMIIREAEGGTAVPADVLAERTSIRTKSNDKEAEVNAISTFDEFVSFDNQEWTVTKKICTETYDGSETTLTYGPETEDVVVIYSGIDNLWGDEENSPTFSSHVKN